MVPYLVIKLWLMKIPAWFYGADVIAEIFTNALLAFFTAFPFWWLIEWFSFRKKTSETGAIQRRFLDEARVSLNRFIHHLKNPDMPFKDVRIPDYFSTLTEDDYFDTITSFMTRPDEGPFDNLRHPIINHIAHEKIRMNRLLSYIEPYRETFSIEFNSALMTYKEAQDVMDNLFSTGNPYDRMDLVVEFYRDLMNALFHLENAHRMSYASSAMIRTFY